MDVSISSYSDVLKCRDAFVRDLASVNGVEMTDTDWETLFKGSQTEGGGGEGKAKNIMGEMIRKERRETAG
jgi:hypothetical protein